MSARPPTASSTFSGAGSAGMVDLGHETDLGGRVAGIDEAGRGPWAGPVCAAAVCLGPDARAALAGVTDSKALTRKRRDTLLERVRAHADVGVGWASAAEVDHHNVLQASLLAMQRAVAALAESPDHALVDGRQVPALACPAHCLVKGDRRSLSVAAASIVAKVERDRHMAILDARHPGYGWARNAGYGTAEHRDALARLGPSPEHRRSFKPVRAAEGR
mgnify:CR=1 FL=1